MLAAVAGGGVVLNLLVGVFLEGGKGLDGADCLDGLSSEIGAFLDEAGCVGEDGQEEGCFHLRRDIG